MNIQTFKIFCDLIDTKSFSKAAEMNSVSQSAVSQQIKNLEKRYNVVFIERGKGSLILTHEGTILHEYAQKILSTYKDMKNSLDHYSDIIAGEIKVSTIYSVGLHELPPYLKVFFKKCSKVKVTVQYNRTNNIYNDLIANTIDIGIVAFPKEHTAIQITPFKMDHLVLICNPNHPMAKLDRVEELEILNDLSFCSFEKDIPTRKHIDAIFAYYNIKVNISMGFDNVETIKRMVEVDDNLVSIVPTATITREVEAGTLKAISILNNQFIRPIAIITKKGRNQSKATKNFIELLKNYDSKNDFIDENCCTNK